jgi:cell wall assembly regulator SMI1
MKELERAIRQGDLAQVRRLLEKSASANVLFKDGAAPLHHAVSTENLEMVKLLLDAGADPNSVSKGNEDTPISLAAEGGQVETVRTLLEGGANPNSENSLGLSPLGLAAMGETDDHVEILRALIRGGANLDGGGVCTALMCSLDGLLESARVLLEAGADVNASRSPRGTALHMAIEDNKADFVALLLKHGADLMARTPDDADYPNRTALELAGDWKRRKLIPLLTAASGGAVPPGPAAAPAPASQVWGEIKDHLAEASPKLLKSLRKGVSPTELGALEKTVGHPLPDSIKAVYLANNGQKDSSNPLIPTEDALADGYSLMPIHDILSDWSMLNGLLTDGEFEGRKAASDKGVRKDWWNPGWIPFAGDGEGDYLALDLVPTPEGKKGQIIQIDHESGRRKLLTSSFDEWLANLAQDLASEDED